MTGRVCASVLGLLVVAVLPAQATTAQLSNDGRLRLTGQTAQVALGEPFALRLLVEGATDPTSLEVTVSVHERITTRSGFDRSLEGAALGDRMTTQRAEPLATGSVALTFEGVGAGLPRYPGGGVYPVAAALLAGGTVIDRLVTHLILLPTGSEAEPLRVAWVQPFGSDPALSPEGTVEFEAGEKSTLAELAEALAAADVPFTAVPVPETLDALSSDRAGEAILDDLQRALSGQQVIAGPYVDVDVDTLARPGLDQELVIQRRRGADVLEGLGLTPDFRTWSVDESMGDAGLARLQDAFVDRLIIAEERLEPLDLPLDRTLTSPFSLDAGQGEAVAAVEVEAGLSRHFEQGGDQVLAGRHLVADMAFLFYERPGLEVRGVTVRPPEGWAATAPFLETVFDALAGTPILRAVTVEELFRSVEPLEESDGDTVIRRRLGGTSGGAIVAPERLLGARASIASLESMLGPVNGRTDLLERLVLVSQAEGLNETMRATYLDGVEAQITERLGTVSVVEGGGYRLTAQEGTIPLTLQRDANHPVRISLVLASEKIDFLDGDDATPGRLQRELVLDEATTSLTIRVRTRTGGEFPLLVSITTPDGGREVSRTSLTVRSGPAWVGVGLSVGAGLFLLVWWARHWRTARRDRRLVAVPA